MNHDKMISAPNYEYDKNLDIQNEISNNFSEMRRGSGPTYKEANLRQLRRLMDLDFEAKRQDLSGYELALQQEVEISFLIEEQRTIILNSKDKKENIENRRGAYFLQVGNLDNEIRERSEKKIVKIKNYFGIKDRKIRRLNQEKESLNLERARSQVELYNLGKDISQANRIINELKDRNPRQEFLEKFETPLSLAEKEKLLTFENLSQLTTNEYLKLWRRLNPFFVTHVTRQGIRDHNDAWHSDGLHEFSNGFVSMLNSSKKIAPAREVRDGIGREFDESQVEKYLKKEFFYKHPDKNYAKDELNGDSDAKIKQLLTEINLTKEHSVLSWADKSSVHFGVNCVLDNYYGGESDNEIFCVYPGDVIASQCFFNGSRVKFNDNPGKDFGKNDLFVISKELSIPLDAGLVFIPEDTMVDRHTGSRYETEKSIKNGREVLNPVLGIDHRKFATWFQNLNSEELQAAEKDRLYIIEMRYRLERGFFGEEYKSMPGGLEKCLFEKLNGQIGSQRFSLEKQLYSLGISKLNVIKMITQGHSFLNEMERLFSGSVNLTRYTDSKEESDLLSELPVSEKNIFALERYLFGCGIFQEAKNAISSKEYWEKYFNENPNQRPKHVIYYKGNPTDSIKNLLRENGIFTEDKLTGEITGRSDTSKDEGGYLGFNHNEIDSKEYEESSEEKKKFTEMAKKIIADYYGLNIEEN